MTVPAVRNQNKAVRWLLLIAAVPLCIGAYFAGSIAKLSLWPVADRTPAAPDKPALFVDPAALELGDLWEASDVTIPLVIENTTTEPAVISEFRTGCGCSSVEPPEVTIPPLGKVEVKVRIDLTVRLSYMSGLARRPLLLDITPIVNQTLLPGVRWQLRGSVLAWASVDTTQLKFETLCAQGDASVAKRVRITAHQPLRTVEATATGDSAEVQVVPSGDGTNFSLLVSPDPRLPVGPFRFTVAVTPVTADGVRRSCASVEVSGEMLPPTRVIPALVLLGEAKVGSTLEGEVVLRLPAMGEWSVSQVAADTEDASPRLLDRTGRELRYAVRHTVRKAGDQSARLTFTLVSKDGRKHTAETRVTCYGLNP